MYQDQDSEFSIGISSSVYLDKLTEWQRNNPPFEKGMLVAVYNNSLHHHPLCVGIIERQFFDGENWKYDIAPREGGALRGIKSYCLDKLAPDECRAWFRSV